MRLLGLENSGKIEYPISYEILEQILGVTEVEYYIFCIIRLEKKRFVVIRWPNIVGEKKLHVPASVKYILIRYPKF